MGTTYQTPIANDYLEIRAELGTALSALLALATETRAPPAATQVICGLQGGLDDPFLFVVVGEVKAGKSTLLNALFGRDFCRVDVLPATDRVNVFKFADEPREESPTPEIVERYLPIAFLRDFNLVDTPGTNTMVDGHQAITEHFAPQADLIVFVFSVVNPWGASAWHYLEHLHSGLYKNVVFVLQQIDLREDREVEAIVRHLQQTAVTRLGRAVPVFPVSAKKAFLSKTTGVDKPRLWTESRFGLLEDYVNEMVGTGEARRAKLRGVDRSAQAVLRAFADQLREGERGAANDLVALEQARTALIQAQAGGAAQLEAFSRGLDTAFSRCQHQGEHLLGQRLQFWKSIHRDRQWPAEFQRNLESMLRAAVTRQLDHALDLLEGELQALWRRVHASLDGGLGPEARQRLGAPVVEFHDQACRLRARVELAVVECLGDERIERALQAAFAELTSSLQLPVICAVFGGAMTAILIITRAASIWLVAALGALAISAALRGAALAASRRHRILATYRLQMKGRQEELGRAIGERIKQATEMYYHRIVHVCAPLASYCVARREGYRPFLDRIASLEAAFVKIAARL